MVRTLLEASTGRPLLRPRVLLILTFIVLMPTATATPLPDTYPLASVGKGPTPLDPNLYRWLSEHSEQPSPFTLEPAKFAELVAKQDPLTALYLKFTRLAQDTSVPPPPARADAASPPAATIDPAAERALVDQAYKVLTGGPATQQTALNHPLLPFLYLEMLKSGVLTPTEQREAQQRFHQISAGTCASKQSFYDELNRENLTVLPDDGLRELVTRLDVYRSKAFKRNALHRFIALLPENRQGAVGDQLLAAAQPYPDVIKSSPWMHALAEKTGKTGDSHEPGGSFAKARLLAQHRQCAKAKDLMVATLRTVKGTASLADAVGTGKAIEGCFRAQDRRQRSEFWRLITKQMDQTYGVDGWAESILRLGFIDWSHNSFADAKTSFQDVIRKTEGKFKKYEARALYALARIAENEGDSDRAATLYQDYMTRFPEQENFEEALMSAVLLRTDKGDWANVSSELDTLIQAQTMLPQDERSTSALSFALFWAGRAHLEQNRPREAAELWRRVATEYFSTYYGALGHYMLEKVEGRALALAPSRTPTFRMDTLREAFSLPDQQKVKRIEALMHLGLKNEAICELEELDVADGKPEKMAVKALVMYAAGRWLEAVKVYDAIPRSFRSALPVGFERVLFPQRFGDEIRALAARAKVDPDLVLAIIRQESVFNPLARSPVGAMGLMQLMPDTAHLEMKRIDSSYLAPDAKRLLNQQIMNPLGLLVAQNNLTIGVHHVRSLLDKYLSPVYVLSAYNASPAAAHRWMQTLPTHDALAFIERIPYKETRAYVKLVLRNYFYYKRWYGSSQDALMHLDTVASPLLAVLSAKGEHAVKPREKVAAPSAATALPVEAEIMGPPRPVAAPAEADEDE